MSRLLRIRERIRTSLWAVPSLCVLAAGTASFLLLNADRQLSAETDAWYLFSGSADGARTLLSTISASMLTFTALVFSITIVALQLASGQFSPRVQATFLRDGVSKWTLGIFIGTFTYAMLVLRSVRGGSDGISPFVPAISVAAAVVLILISIAFFVRYVDHIAHSIRAVSVIRDVAGRTKSRIEQLYPEAVGEPADEQAFEPPENEEPVLVEAKSAGALASVDPDRLARIASECEVVVELVRYVGDFVPSGAPLARIWGTRAADAAGDAHRALSLAAERTIEQDAAFGIRQLVDIADRALSPGVNDPSTAVQAIDALHDLLRVLVRRQFPSPARAGDDGRILVYAPRPGWEEMLGLALDEIRRSGSESIQIARRLRWLLEDLRSIAPPSRRPAIDRQVEELDATVRDAFAGRDLEKARRPSAQGNV